MVVCAAHTTQYLDVLDFDRAVLLLHVSLLHCDIVALPASLHPNSPRQAEKFLPNILKALESERKDPEPSDEAVGIWMSLVLDDT